jgi:hypothetical protein
MCTDVHVKYPLFSSDFMKLGYSRQIFEKYSSLKFHENSSSTFWWTDGRTDRQKGRVRHEEGNSRLSQVCHSTKRVNCIRWIVFWRVLPPTECYNSVVLMERCKNDTFSLEVSSFVCYSCCFVVNCDVLFMCKCVLPPGVNPIAVDKHINRIRELDGRLVTTILYSFAIWS